MRLFYIYVRFKVIDCICNVILFRIYKKKKCKFYGVKNVKM